MGVDVTVIIPESSHPNLPLHEADAKFLGTGILFQVKQNMRWVECIVPEEQRGRLRPYVTYKTLNLWCRNLFQQ